MLAFPWRLTLPPHPSLAVIFRPCVSLNSQRTLQWDSVVAENYSNKKKIFKAFSTFSSSSLSARTGLSLRFPHQQGCKEKRVPLAQVRQLPLCLFSLVDVDGITTRVVRLLLSEQNFKARCCCPGRISKCCCCCPGRISKRCCCCNIILTCRHQLFMLYFFFFPLAKLV